MEQSHLLQASKPLNNVQLEGQTSTKSEQGFQFFMSEQKLIRNPYAWPVDTQPSWHGGQHHGGPRHVIWRILLRDMSLNTKLDTNETCLFILLRELTTSFRAFSYERSLYPILGTRETS